MRLILYLLASLFRARLHQCRLWPSPTISRPVWIPLRNDRSDDGHGGCFVHADL